MLKSFTATASLVAFSVFAIGCSGGSSATLDQSTPQATVEGFYGAMMESDTETALMYVDPSVVSTEDFERKWDEVSQWTYKSVTVGEVTGKYVEIEMTVEIDGDEDGGSDEVEVVESDGKWWIVDLPS